MLKLEDFNRVSGVYRLGGYAFREVVPGEVVLTIGGYCFLGKFETAAAALQYLNEFENNYAELKTELKEIHGEKEAEVVWKNMLPNILSARENYTCDFYPDNTIEIPTGFLYKKVGKVLLVPIARDKKTSQILAKCEAGVWVNDPDGDGYALYCPEAKCYLARHCEEYLDA